MSMTVFYTPSEEYDPHGTLEPRIYGLSLADAQAIETDALVMWTEGNEVLGIGYRSPTPYCHFFYKHEPVVNPWAFFIGLEERPKSPERPEPVKPGERVMVDNEVFAKLNAAASIFGDLP